VVGGDKDLHSLNPLRPSAWAASIAGDPRTTGDDRGMWVISPLPLDQSRILVLFQLEITNK